MKLRQDCSHIFSPAASHSLFEQPAGSQPKKRTHDALSQQLLPSLSSGSTPVLTASMAVMGSESASASASAFDAKRLRSSLSTHASANDAVTPSSSGNSHTAASLTATVTMFESNVRASCHACKCKKDPQELV